MACWGRPPPPTAACSVAVKCSVCKSVSDTYDPYLDVALEIRVRTTAGCAWSRLPEAGEAGEAGKQGWRMTQAGRERNAGSVTALK